MTLTAGPWTRRPVSGGPDARGAAPWDHRPPAWPPASASTRPRSASRRTSPAPATTGSWPAWPAGVGRYLGVDPTVVRLALVVLTFANGLGVVALPGRAGRCSPTRTAGAHRRRRPGRPPPSGPWAWACSPSAPCSCSAGPAWCSRPGWCGPCPVGDRLRPRVGAHRRGGPHPRPALAGGRRRRAARRRARACCSRRAACCPPSAASAWRCWPPASASRCCSGPGSCGCGATSASSGASASAPRSDRRSPPTCTTRCCRRSRSSSAPKRPGGPAPWPGVRSASCGPGCSTSGRRTATATSPRSSAALEQVVTDVEDRHDVEVDLVAGGRLRRWSLASTPSWPPCARRPTTPPATRAWPR